MRSEKKEIVKDAKRNTQILQITLLMEFFIYTCVMQCHPHDSSNLTISAIFQIKMYYM